MRSFNIKYNNYFLQNYTMQYVYIIILTIFLYTITTYIDKRKNPDNNNNNMSWVFLFFSLILSIVIVHLLFGSTISIKNDFIGGGEKITDILQEIDVGLPDF
jgi:uncharacterized membrane protein